jgi:adenylate cyclase
MRAVSPDQRLQFRIGINVGDVIVEDGDIFGDGVNVAARLERWRRRAASAFPATVRDKVGDRLGVGLEDLGEQTVKNIVRPIRAYRIVLDAVASRHDSCAPPSPRASRRSSCFPS